LIIFNAPDPSEYDECFSNFSPSPIVYDGVKYPTVEHAFQAQKSPDYLIRLSISNLKTPQQAKRAGRAITMRPDWSKVRYDIMVACLREKFSVPEYKELLLGTGDEEIVEDASEWDDRVWGRGKNGDGQNLLGKALMQVRDELGQ
jgi:ribA/ribD-fused uncharacterized protein